MLTDLFIRDFALIEELHLSFGPGFSVLTGETGAGKSIIIDALQMALGGRASADDVRTGAGEARVEAVFDLAALPEARRLAAAMGLGDPDENTLILTREIGRSGRSASRVNGRPATLSAMRQIAARLVDLRGQHEAQGLFRPETHRDLLDAAGGPALLALRGRVAALAGERARLSCERAAILGDEKERLRRLDLLRYQVEEIDRANPRPGEAEELAARRRVLANAERLAGAAARAYAVLYEGLSGRPAAADELGRLAAELLHLAAVDPRLQPLGELLQGTALQAAEVARELRRYQDGLAYEPGELASVDERLDLLRRLARKYGESVEEILAFRREAASEIARLECAEASAAEMEARLAELEASLAVMAADLSARRAEAAARLEEGVAAEMAELGLEKAHFQVSLRRRPDPDGLEVGGERVACDAGGVDQVEFLFSANPGEPLQPLARVASGGEASRLALALNTVLAGAGGVPTLVFDEVDAGLGGRAAQAVARKLSALGRCRQVLCVTHLALVAAAADAHYTVGKAEEGGRTRVAARRLVDGERPAELARMLAGDGSGEISLQHARAMLAGARAGPAEVAAFPAAGERAASP